MNKKPIYIKLSDGEIDKTTEIDRVDYGVNLDYDKQGFLCGIEVLGYKELTIGLDALTLDQLINSVKEECAKNAEDYMEERTYEALSYTDVKRLAKAIRNKK